MKEVAFARAVIAIGGVRHESGIVGGESLFCADSDVQKAASLAVAGGFTVEAASARARDLCDSDAFRTAHARLVDALIREPHLDQAEVARILT